MTNQQWIAEWSSWLEDVINADALSAVKEMATNKLAELRKRAAKQDDDRGGD